MRTFCCAVLLALASMDVHAALVPPFFIDAVVAIGSGRDSKWSTDGSGFFYGYLVKDDPDPLKRLYEVFLVTNRHVIGTRDQVSVRLNHKDVFGQGEVFDIPRISWFVHPDSSVDLAAARVNWQFLMDRGIDVKFFANDIHAADTAKMKDLGVSAGDAIFVLGFPMNLAGTQRNFVIVRPGAIARISDFMASVSPTLLVDSHVFPGNSGGPVVLQPCALSIDGTKGSQAAYLLGVVQNFIPYIDVAISPLTQRARVTFEENSGLSEVVPVSRINEAIKAWRDSQSPSPQVPLKTAPGKP